MPSAPVKNKIVKSNPDVIVETNLFFTKDKKNTIEKNIQKQKLVFIQLMSLFIWN